MWKHSGRRIDFNGDVVELIKKKEGKRLKLENEILEEKFSEAVVEVVVVERDNL